MKCLLMDEIVYAPNYIMPSVMGCKAHMSITSICTTIVLSLYHHHEHHQHFFVITFDDVLSPVASFSQLHIWSCKVAVTLQFARFLYADWCPPTSIHCLFVIPPTNFPISLHLVDSSSYKLQR